MRFSGTAHASRVVSRRGGGSSAKIVDIPERGDFSPNRGPPEWPGRPFPVNPPPGQPPPAPQSSDVPVDPEVLDLGVLEEMGIIPGSGAGSIPSDIITIFLREERPRMEKIVGLAVERKVPELAQAAHNIAGSSAILGARQVQVTSIALELAVRAQDWPAVATHLTALLSAWGRLEEALIRYRGP